MFRIVEKYRGSTISRFESMKNFRNRQNILGIDELHFDGLPFWRTLAALKPSSGARVPVERGAGARIQATFTTEGDSNPLTTEYGHLVLCPLTVARNSYLLLLE